MKIVLLLMVKNEERVIRRCLNSVLSIIDGCVIMDTGSTDSTLQQIEQFQVDCPHLKHHLVHLPFENFGSNRFQLLRHGQLFVSSLVTMQEKEKDNEKWALESTYFLLLDADMVLKLKLLVDKVEDVKNEIQRDLCASKVWYVVQESTHHKYINVRFMRSDLVVPCLGRTHEYWAYHLCPQLKDEEKESVQVLERLCIDDREDGGCKDNKFSRDILLLQLDRNEDPHEFRWIYFLIQTYMALKNYAQAYTSIHDFFNLTTINRSYAYEVLIYEYQCICNLDLPPHLENKKQKKRNVLERMNNMDNESVEGLLYWADYYLKDEQNEYKYFEILEQAITIAERGPPSLKHGIFFRNSLYQYEPWLKYAHAASFYTPCFLSLASPPPTKVIFPSVVPDDDNDNAENNKKSKKNKIVSNGCKYLEYLSVQPNLPLHIRSRVSDLLYYFAPFLYLSSYHRVPVKTSPSFYPMNSSWLLPNIGIVRAVNFSPSYPSRFSSWSNRSTDKNKNKNIGFPTLKGGESLKNEHWLIFFELPTSIDDVKIEQQILIEFPCLNGISGQLVTQEGNPIEASLEDLRIYRYEKQKERGKEKETLYFIATDMTGRNRKTGLVYGRIEIDRIHSKAIVHDIQSLDYENSERLVEKNWLPFYKEDRLHWLYNSVDPILVLNEQCVPVVKGNENYRIPHFRTSCMLSSSYHFRWKDEDKIHAYYLIKVHELSCIKMNWGERHSPIKERERRYLHRFLLFNEDFKLCYYTRALKVGGEHEMVYIMSMGYSTPNEIMLSVGVNDHEAWMCKLSLHQLDKLFMPFPSDQVLK
jgi:glycosyltransferase involved in cell wall biosynthesis